MTGSDEQTSRPFLTAEWRHLGLVTWKVDSALLAPELPPGCELDLRDGHAFVSLVAFDFLDTRVKGVRWPGHVNFPEINLRFYVRHDGQRGVCFVRELVPKRLIAWIARGIYNEPYVSTAMRSKVSHDASRIESLHRFRFAGKLHEARFRGLRETIVPPEDSNEHFFKEHSWGFGRSRGGTLRRYRVDHPVWAIHREATAELDVDFAAVYGEKWGFLRDRTPDFVIFAVGSKVAVYPHAESLKTPPRSAAMDV